MAQHFDITRRQFGVGALAAFASVSAAGLLSGCQKVNQSQQDSASSSQAENGGGADAINDSLSDGKETVKIAYLPITHALPVFQVAKDLQADSSSVIQVQLVQYGSWPELMDALNSGKVDGASVLVELAMRAAEQGIGVKAAALGHRDGNVIVASKAVQATSDLAGKTIAIPARQSSHYILVLQALSEAGLSEADVSITELAPTEMPSALASGRVDAYCVAEPFGAKGVESAGGHVLANSEDLWSDSVCCALAVNDAFLDGRPQVAKAFIEAYKRAGDTLDESGDALDIAKEFLNQTDDVLKTSLQWISYRDLTIDEATYNELVRRVIAAGLSENPPAFVDFVVNEGDLA